MNVMRWRHHPGDETGAAIIEFALVVPLLLILVWGIIEAGRAFYTISSLASAVRDGARYGASCDLGLPGVLPQMNPSCEGAIRGIVTNAFQPLGAPLDPLNIAVTVPSVGSSPGIRVQATYDYQPITPVVGWDLTIRRAAVFRYERRP